MKKATPLQTNQSRHKKELSYSFSKSSSNLKNNDQIKSNINSLSKAPSYFNLNKSNKKHKVELNNLWENFNENFNIASLEELRDNVFFRAFCDFSTKYEIQISSTLNLIPGTEEGKEIISDERYWIIFIHTNLYRFDYERILTIFNNALDNNEFNNPFLFFDYFLLICAKFSQVEIMNLNPMLIPKKFVEIYAGNKDKIFKYLNFPLKINENILPVSNIETTKTKIEDDVNENEFSFSQETNIKDEKAGKKVLQKSSSLNNQCKGDILINNELIEDEIYKEKFEWNDMVSFKESGFKLNFNLKSENTTEKKMEENTANLDKFQLKDESLIIEKINFYEEIEDEIYLENPINMGESLAEKYLAPESGDVRPQKVMNKNLECKDNTKEVDDFLSEFNEDDNVKIFQPNIKFTFEEEPIHDSFYIIDNNFHNCGNFAILELSDDSKKRYGTDYIVTPLKQYNNKEEIKKANEDLKKISDHCKYKDFTYKPFNRNLSEVLLKYTNEMKENKKFCFKEVNK